MVQGRRILLLDDIFTTGATLSACAKVLKQAGAGRVTALVLASDRN
jgi:predicted amidophosphoribosyltransferase